MKTTYLKFFSLIKTTIYLTVFLSINIEPAQSTNLFDKIKQKTTSVTDTVSKSLENQRKEAGNYFSESFDKLGEYTSEAINGVGVFFEDFMNDFETNKDVFEAAGFYLMSANLYIAYPPKISLTFKNGEILEEKEYTDLQNSLSDTPILKGLLEVLVSMRKIKSGKHLPAMTTVVLGLPPSVYLTFPLDKK